MNAIRSMVLVSSDPQSMELGAQHVFNLFQDEIKRFGLDKEISLQMVGDIGRHDAMPMVVVYPEAIVYGPVKPENVHHLVREIQRSTGAIVRPTWRRGYGLPTACTY